MEKVMRTVQTWNMSSILNGISGKITIMGMSLPVYLLAAAVILFAAAQGILPQNMVGALAIMMILGSALNLLGNKLPVIPSYLGGGAVFCIFASSAMASFGLLPGSVVDNCDAFMNEIGFLDFYIAALIAKAGNSFPSLNGNGRLMQTDEADSPKEKEHPDLAAMGTGLLFAMAFFTAGVLISQIFPNIHAYAFMIIIVVICKVFGLVPDKYEKAAVQWSQFVMKNFTSALLAGIGIALLDLKALGAALSSEFLFICTVIIVTVAACAGFLGRLAGFYPVESAITAGLCANSMGGTGNIAVLSASDRMGLIPFAQMATRLGGAVILISASVLIRILI